MSVDASWMALSDELAERVARLSESVVRVAGRRRPASGVAWSEPGLVVTAAHALGADDAVEVGLPDGRSAPGEVVGVDPGTDLAVVRLGGGALAAPAWNEEAPARTGALALAVSRPGRAHRAALGVVARVADAFRAEGGGRVDRWVELDFGGQPGFSGSLVADLAGRPLGLGSGGLVRGTALALPTPTVRRVVRALLEHGAVRRGYLGLSTLPVDLPPGVGGVERPGSALLVTGVDPSGPSAGAGLLVGDLLLALDGAPLAHPRDLVERLDEERIGVEVVLQVWRAGAAREVRVTVGTRPSAGRGGCGGGR